MNCFLLSLFALLITSPAFAEGRYQDGGCTAEQMDSFCSFIGFLLPALLVLMVVGFIGDAYKMRTDPAYRARAEQWRREYDEKQRRGY